MANSTRMELTFRNQAGQQFKTSVPRLISNLEPTALFEELSDIPMVTTHRSRVTSSQLSTGRCVKTSYVTTTKIKLLEKKG